MTWRSVISWGAKAGLTVFGLLLLIYFVARNIFIGYEAYSTKGLVLAVVIYLITVFFMIWGGLSFRKDNGNSISFFEAFLAVLVIGSFSGFMYLLASFLITNFINPGIQETIFENTIVNMQMMMRKYNSSEEQILEAVANVKANRRTFSLTEYGTAYTLEVLKKYLITSVLIALFVKRNPDLIKSPETTA